MADKTREGNGQSKRREGLEIAIDRAWDDAKKNHGAQSGDTLTVHIQIIGDNPIRGYKVKVCP
jgi:hypothetical protein